MKQDKIDLGPSYLASLRCFHSIGSVMNGGKKIPFAGLIGKGEISQDDEISPENIYKTIQLHYVDNLRFTDVKQHSQTLPYQTMQSGDIAGYKKAGREMSSAYRTTHVTVACLSVAVGRGLVLIREALQRQESDGPRLRAPSPRRSGSMLFAGGNYPGLTNITPEQRSYLIGKRYQEEKKERGNDFRGNQYAKEVGGNSCHLATSEVIAKEVGVVPRTVREAETYARSVDEKGHDETI